MNWRQREGQNKNQAYIQLPPTVYRSDFSRLNRSILPLLPMTPNHLFAHERKKTKKDIHTPHNNSLLGEYFRNRLSLPNGAFVTRADLDRYGRTDVLFYKFDSENYYMDFSVQ